ncbi:MAG: radical SAM protein [Acidobacteriia bacterium]|nr:radical SAM protein [Terriglobia bacterium]
MSLSIQIDASSHCQLACPLCPTADGRVRAAQGAGHLKLSDFEALLDRNPQIAHVELSNYGEMFLNPQLAAILKSAHERKVSVSGSNGVNLNFAREDALDAVVRYRVRALTCSIDGATQETYARYRVNGNLERVLGHIDRIRELRRKYRSAFPLLDWQFVVFGHNEHELPVARAMAAERGMELVPRLSWDDGFSPVKDNDLVRIESGLGAASRSEYRERRGAEYTRSICYQLWHAPVLNWNGSMLGCCVNFWGDFGVNVFESGLDAAMLSPKIEYARRMLTGEAAPAEGIPCTTCDQYVALRESGGWLNAEEIQKSSGARFVAGIVLEADPSVRFAQVSIAAGAAGARFENSGRLFRCGVDTAAYFAPAGPGKYTIQARGLGRSGWMPAVSRTIEIAPRPLCQEFSLDVSGSPATPEQGGEVDRLPLWIR